MTEAVNNSEQWVYEICRNSFLSIWSYVNPQGRAGNELCDILVVCDPHVVIVSVKNVVLSESGDRALDRERWTRRAIDASLRQIKGAIRWMDSADYVARKDGTKGLPLPARERRVYHRIAVAFGGRNKVTIAPSAVPDHNPYHILDEQSFFLLVRHLNTISDFVDYLAAKEALLARAKVFINGGEENLLAMYLTAGRAFPREPTMLLVEGDLWDGLNGMPEFHAKLREDEVSYAWDGLIEFFCETGFDGPRWQGPGLSEIERGLRVMARENRFARRHLGWALRDFNRGAKAGRLRARIVQSLSGVGYVFFVYDNGSSRKERRQELTCRCLAALCGFEQCSSIIGVNFNRPGEKPRDAYTSDLVVIQRGDEPWPVQILENARICRDDLGYFKTPEKSHYHFDEYPTRRIEKQGSSQSAPRELTQ